MNRRDKQLWEKGIEEAKEQAFEIVLSALIVTLYEEFGFREVRLDRVLQGVAKQCDFMCGMIDHDTYREFAEEKTKINLERYYLRKE